MIWIRRFHLKANRQTSDISGSHTITAGSSASTRKNRWVDHINPLTDDMITTQHKNPGFMCYTTCCICRFPLVYHYDINLNAQFLSNIIFKSELQCCYQCCCSVVAYVETWVYVVASYRESTIYSFLWYLSITQPFSLKIFFITIQIWWKLIFFRSQTLNLKSVKVTYLGFNHGILGLGLNIARGPGFCSQNTKGR